MRYHLNVTHLVTESSLLQASVLYWIKGMTGQVIPQLFARLRQKVVVASNLCCVAIMWILIQHTTS